MGIIKSLRSFLYFTSIQLIFILAFLIYFKHFSSALAFSATWIAACGNVVFITWMAKVLTGDFGNEASKSLVFFAALMKYSLLAVCFFFLAKYLGSEIFWVLLALGVVLVSLVVVAFTGQLTREPNGSF